MHLKGPAAAWVDRERNREGKNNVFLLFYIGSRKITTISALPPPSVMECETGPMTIIYCSVKY